MLPCIVCNKPLKSAINNPQSPVQPASGLTFEGNGAYGSNFDPMDGRLSLIINLCDDCIETKGKEGLVLLRTTQRPVHPEPSYAPYDLKNVF